MSDWRNYVDEVELRKTIGILKPNGQLFEVRVMGEGKKPLSGYFKSADQLIKAFDKISLAGQNVYITLHRLKEACYNRHQRDAFKAGATATTDTDVERMEWFFIDVDPVRLSGISSSREELKAAKDVWIQVHNYLKDIGFSEPVCAASGNGYHLLYRIDLDCSPESIKLIENGLKVLSNLFSNDMAKVDVVNKNPSRICKLYGTMAQKGANSEERPHRMSKILRAETEITGREFLEKLSADFFQDPEPTGRAYERFDLQNWMSMALKSTGSILETIARSTNWKSALLITATREVTARSSIILMEQLLSNATTIPASSINGPMCGSCSTRMCMITLMMGISMTGMPNTGPTG